MARKLVNWVDSFMSYTKLFGSPELFRKWVAIYTVGAILERRVWFRTSIGPVYPNLYTILVGPAGAGKTNLTHAAYNMVSDMGGRFIAPTNVSRAALIDELSDARQQVPSPDLREVLDYNSLIIYSNELGTLIPEYSSDLITVLTDLYDCKRFEESKRILKKKITMKDVQLNLLAGTTPSYLNNLLPEGAWDQGFISRTLLIYSGYVNIVDPFNVIDTNQSLYDNLVHDLRIMGESFGAFKWTDEAIEAYRAWHKTGFSPVPNHPKLMYYNSRRHTQTWKLAMISAVAQQGNNMIIGIDNFTEALDWLLEAERAMPDIFKAMVTGGASQIIKDTWYFAYERYLSKNKPVPETEIWEYITARAPIGDVPRILDAMCRNGILKEQMAIGVGKVYEVRPMN